MVNKRTLAVCMVLMAIPIYGRGKKASRGILDRQALAEVRSYCIEKGGLSDSDRYLLDGFLKAESKPKHLLTKMPWKLVEDCEHASPDAIITLEFVPLNWVNLSPGQTVGPPVSRTDSRDPEAPIRVMLTVNDSAQKLLYRTEAMPLTTDATPADGGVIEGSDPLDHPNRGGPVSRHDALYHVFWQLTDDLLAISRPGITCAVSSGRDRFGIPEPIAQVL